MSPQEHTDAASHAMEQAKAFTYVSSDTAVAFALIGLTHAVLAVGKAIEWQLHDLTEAVER